GADRQCPRRVYAAAEGGQDAHAPVTQLVAEAFDDHSAIAGDRARGLLLLGQVVQQIARGEFVEAMLGAECGEGVGGGERNDAAAELAQRAAQLDRPASGVAMPE